MGFRAFVAGLVAAAFAAAAAADVGHDPYLNGGIQGRAQGQNAARVQVRWNFQCFQDEFGESTFQYTIRVTRLVPKPERALVVSTGTTRDGVADVVLGPGLWRADANPFRCETGVRTVSTAPEIGKPFIVPDYCSWTAFTLSGRVVVQRATRKATLDAGERVRPGETIGVRGRGHLELRNEDANVLRLGSDARVRIERGSCATSPGWRVAVLEGELRASSGDAGAPYETATPHATVSGRSATWRVRVDAKRTLLKEVIGSVRVRGRVTREP